MIKQVKAQGGHCQWSSRDSVEQLVQIPVQKVKSSIHMQVNQEIPAITTYSSSALPSA